MEHYSRLIAKGMTITLCKLNTLIKVVCTSTLQKVRYSFYFAFAFRLAHITILHLHTDPTVYCILSTAYEPPTSRAS